MFDVGLGYVGLPLTDELTKLYSMIVVDINSERLNKLGNYCGRTKELTDDELRSETSHITDCLFAKKSDAEYRKV
tara:strand:+ start:236 stop:460 length:225 start_codon:yes stop_codon:yes gene_type:complete